MASYLLSLVSSRLVSFFNKTFYSKRRSFLFLLLSISIVVVTALGVHKANRSSSNHTRSASSAKIVALPTAHQTKLKEYVYAGGRMLSSEEKSCVPTLSTTSVNLPQGGGSGSINFTLSSGCSWIATSNASWISLGTTSSGTGSGIVSYSILLNSGAQRSGTLSINGQVFTIVQSPDPGSCIYSLNKSGETISEQGGNGALNLSSGGGCPWTATSNASWLSITSATSGNGSATINYTVTANSGQQRSGTITAGGQNFTVTQAPNQASCSFSQQFSANQNSASFLCCDR